MRQSRDGARAMTRSARASQFNVDEARRQQTQMQEQLRATQQAREELNQGLSEEQQLAVRQRNERMQQMHQRVQERLQALDRELAGPNIVAQRVADESRNTEREMKAYQNEFREMGKDLGLGND